MFEGKSKIDFLFYALFLVFVIIFLFFVSFISITIIVGYENVGKFFYNYGSLIGVFIATTTALFAIRSQNENVRIQINADRALENKKREIEDITNALNTLNSLFLTPQRISILNGSSDNINEDINLLMTEVVNRCFDLKIRCISIDKDLEWVVDDYCRILWGLLVVKSIDLNKSDMTLDEIVKYIIDSQGETRDKGFIEHVKKGEVNDLLELLPQKISSLSSELKEYLLQKKLEK